MNDNHALTTANLLASLPQVLRDDESMAAIAGSVADVLEKRREEIRTIAIYNRIDELPEELLDILAKDFKVDWWDADSSLEAKRETLKNSWHIHRILGTKAAVTTAVSAFCKEFSVQEWWEYGGTVGCFRIQTGDYNTLSENAAAIMEKVNKVKRLSAHFEKVEVESQVGTTVGVGMARQTYLSVTYRMEKVELWRTLTDENGATLTDENGSVLIAI